MPKHTQQPPEPEAAPQISEKTHVINSVDVLFNRSLDIPRFYSNHAATMLSPWDFELLFGELFKQPDGNFSARALVSVMVSPPHAKVLARLLTAQVQRYEEAYGPIPEIGKLMPPEEG